MEGTEIGVIGTLQVLGLCTIAGIFIAFVTFEARTHGVKAIASNKFICLTLVQNSATLLFDVMYIVGFMSSFNLTSLVTLSDIGFHRLQASYEFFMTLAINAHVALLYLRSESVFATLLIWLKPSMKVLSILFIIVSSLLGLVYIGSATFPGSQVVSRAYTFIAPTMGLLMFLIDLVSTTGFAYYVHLKRKSLNDQRGLLANSGQVEATELIAKRGILLSVVSTIGFASFAAQQFFSQSSTAHAWLVLLTTYCLLGSGIIWMSLKMQLDMQATTPKASTQTERSQH
jgi:hypothetical protein